MPNEESRAAASSYLAYLPAIMHQAAADGSPPFLGRFLLAFERILTGLPASDFPDLDGIEEAGLEETIARLHTYFDADETPGPPGPNERPQDFLPWLAGWVAIGLREEWSEDKRRRLIGEAVILYRQRGTSAGLLHLLQNYTDLLDVDVQELIHTMQVGVVSTVGVDTVLGSGPPHYFLVHATMPAGAEERLARAIIDQWKPAHTYYDLLARYP